MNTYKTTWLQYYIQDVWFTVQHFLVQVLYATHHVPRVRADGKNNITHSCRNAFKMDRIGLGFLSAYYYNFCLTDRFY